MSVDCEIIDMDKNFADCRKSCRYSGYALCALVPFSVIAIVVGHLPIAGVLAGHGLISLCSGTSYQIYQTSKDEANWKAQNYHEINRSVVPRRNLPRSVDADDILRTILVDPSLHGQYNYCLSYIAKQKPYQDRIQLIRTAIDTFSQQVHTYYHIKLNLVVYETCEDMIMSVVYREVFMYCREFTQKDEKRFLSFKRTRIPDIPEHIKKMEHLDCVVSMLDSLDNLTSSRDKIQLVREMIEKAPPHSSADDLIIFLSLVIQKSQLETAYANYYFMKAFLNLDPNFCPKGKTAYCLNLWYTAIAYLSQDKNSNIVKI